MRLLKHMNRNRIVWGWRRKGEKKRIRRRMKLFIFRRCFDFSLCFSRLLLSDDPATNVTQLRASRPLNICQYFHFVTSHRIFGRFQQEKYKYTCQTNGRNARLFVAGFLFSSINDVQVYRGKSGESLRFDEKSNGFVRMHKFQLYAFETDFVFFIHIFHICSFFSVCHWLIFRFGSPKLTFWQ